MKISIHLGAITLAAAAATLPLTVAAGDSGQAATETQYQWTVDMRGRPPYKRQRVAVEPALDLAAMELAGSGETEVIWERAHRGRPPFKRERVELPVVDGASMELDLNSASKTRFRGRPPFKRHR